MSEIYHNCQERGLSDALHIRAAENCEVDNNYFKNWGHSSLDIDGNSFGSGIVKVSFISFHNNYLTSPDICYGGRIGLDGAHHCEVCNNEIINTSVQTQLNGYYCH
jgi:hypothetical protein